MQKELYTINKEAKRLRDKLKTIWEISEQLDAGDQPYQIKCIDGWGVCEETERVLAETPFLHRCLYEGASYPTWAYERYLDHSIIKSSNRNIEYDENGEDSDGLTEEDHQIEIEKMENELKKVTDKINNSYQYKFEIKCKINDLYKLKENVLSILIEKNKAKIIGYHTFITENKNTSNLKYKDIQLDEAIEDMDNDNENEIGMEYIDHEKYTMRKIVDYNGFRFHYKIVEDNENIKNLGEIDGEISAENELMDGPTVEDSIEKLKKFVEKES